MPSAWPVAGGKGGYRIFRGLGGGDPLATGGGGTMNIRF